jgi:uncharacterized protein YukE
MTDSPSTNGESPATLLELLQQQRDLYHELYQLSEQQSRLIEAGQTEELLALLSKRQELVERLAELNSRLSPYRDHWRSLAEQLPPDEQQRLRRLLDEVQSLLQAIIEQDDSDREHLQSARREVSNELQQTTKAGSAVQAYRGASAAARFTDSQG